MSRFTWIHLVLICIVSASVLSAAPAATHARSAGATHVANELIVRLAPWADPQHFAASAGMALREGGLRKVPGRPIYLFTITDGSTPQQKAAAIAGRSAVIYAEPNFIGTTPEAQKRSSWVVGGSEGEYAAQWAGERIRLGAAHGVSRGAGVTIAILDTGIDLAHPALTGRLVGGYDFVDNDDTPQEEAPAGEDVAARLQGGGASEAYGHGTHVAGLVALVAPEARIMPLRTLRPDGSGDLWTQVLALRYAAAQGADVINLSFSFGEESDFFDDVVAEVTCTARGFSDCRSGQRPGAVVVAAAGNGGSTERQWPAASTLPGVLAVAASTEQDRLADFSSYGSWVPLAAPGDRVLSSVPPGRYAAWSGTSMAAPLTSGVTALVRATSPRLTPADVIRRVVGTAATINAPVKRRLDAGAAVGAP